MNPSELFLGFDPQFLLIQLQVLNSLKNQKGFATIFSLFMSLLLFSFCATFVIVASVLSVKHKANHAAEEAALITASTMDCKSANDIAEANDAEVLTCNINADHVYIETFSRFNNAQISLFKQLGINDDGVIGKAKAKQFIPQELGQLPHLDQLVVAQMLEQFPYQLVPMKVATQVKLLGNLQELLIMLLSK